MNLSRIPTIACMMSLILLAVACQENEFAEGTPPPKVEITDPPPPAISTSDIKEALVIEKKLVNSQTINQGIARLTSEISTAELTQSAAKVSFGLTFEQLDRDLQQMEFTQGTAGTTVTEEFDLKDYGILDILVVMDNSDSMSDEQKNMSTKMAALLSAVANSNWRIGVVTTDPSLGCLKNVINKADANAEATFKNAVKVGTAGSGNERGILQAVNSLKGTCLSQPWIRSVSNLAVVIVSDEDNCSDGAACKGAAYQKASYLTDYLRTIRPDADEGKVYGLIWQPNVGKSKCSSGYAKAHIYDEAIQASGGKSGSICAADYTATLRQISEDLYKSLKVSFRLKGTPAHGSVKVSTGPTEDVTDDVNVIGDVIKFGKTPAEDAKIRVTYRVGASEVVRKLVVGKGIDPEQIVVTINGMRTSPNEYSYDAETGVLAFGNPPADLSKIAVKFRKAGGLEKSFSLKKAVKNVKITINGEAVSDYVLDEATGTIKFPSPPPDGAEIKAEAEVGGENLLYYPFDMTNRDVLGATFKDQPERSVIIGIEKSGVRFAPEDFHEGRVVMVSYRNTAPELDDVTLPHPPLAGSVTFPAYPDCPSSAIHVAGTVVTTTCAIPREGIGIAYAHLTGPPLESVTMTELETPDAGIWKVTVNGAETRDFKREGKTITFTEPLPPEAEVVVRVMVVPKD